MTSGIFTLMVSRPPSTSRVTLALPSPLMTSLEAKVACAQPSKADSIWPVWLASSSIACLPRMQRPGCSLSTTALSSFATASGCNSTSVCTWMPRSAPIASAVRIVSAHCAPPSETATISVALPASFSRTASSTAISQKGFIDIFTFWVSTPVPSLFTRTLTLASTTRLTATRTFILLLGSHEGGHFPRRHKARTAISRSHNRDATDTCQREPRGLSRVRKARFKRLICLLNPSDDDIRRDRHFDRHLDHEGGGLDGGDAPVPRLRRIQALPGLGQGTVQI